mgnify:FL=1
MRVYHYTADPNLSKRPALLVKSDELWNNQSSPISPSFQVFQQGIRELFQSTPSQDLPHMEVLIDIQ